MDKATTTVARSTSRAWCAVSGHAPDLDPVRTCSGQGASVARTWVPTAELHLPGVAAAALLPEPVGREQGAMDRTPLPRTSAHPRSAARRPEPSALWACTHPRSRDAPDFGRWQFAGRLAEQALIDEAPRAGLLRLAGGWHDVQSHHRVQGRGSVVVCSLAL